MARARRAKKSKITKKLIILLMILIAITAGLINYRDQLEVGFTSYFGGTVENYNMNNYIKDVYTDLGSESGGKYKYLPIVYTDKDEQATVASVKAMFQSAGITITEIPDSIKTGSQIKTYSNVTKLETIYTVIIYGDVNSDGVVNVLDAQKIVQHLLYGENSTYNLTGAKKTAANVYESDTNVLDVRDAQRIVQFILSKSSLIDKLPASDVSKDQTAPVITFDSDDTITLTLGETFREPTITVTDDVDRNVRLEKSGTVNTSVAGTYEIVYKATDASGKSTSKTLTVIVKKLNEPKFNSRYARLAVDLSASGTSADFTELVENDFYVTATQTATSSTPIDFTVDYSTVDLTTAGEYTITFTTVPNRDGLVGRTTKKIEVIDPVDNITLTGTPTKVFNEGDTIKLSDLVGVKANITTNSGDVKENIDITNLGKGIYKDYTVKISNDGITYGATANAVYDTVATSGEPISIKVTYQDPSYKAGNVLVNSNYWIEPVDFEFTNVAGGSDNRIQVSVLGNIRTLNVVPAANLEVELCDVLQIGTFTVPNYEQSLENATINIEIKDEIGNVINKDWYRQEINGRTLTINFSPSLRGKYSVSVTASTSNTVTSNTAVIDNITTTESQVVNAVGYKIKTSLTTEEESDTFGYKYNNKKYNYVAKSSPVTNEVIYYHKYNHPYMRQEILAPLNVELDMSKVQFEVSNNNLLIEKISSENGAYAMNSTASAIFKALRIKIADSSTKTSGTETVTMIITSGPENTVVRVPITVRLKPKFEITDFSVTRIDNGTSTTKLYLADDTQTKEMAYTKTAADIGAPAELGKYFAIFKINYVNEAHGEEKVPAAAISDIEVKASTGLQFLDNYYRNLTDADGKYVSSWINVIALSKVGSNYAYVAKVDSDTNAPTVQYVEYVGVSVKTLAQIADMTGLDEDVIAPTYYKYMNLVSEIQIKALDLSVRAKYIDINVNIGTHTPADVTGNEVSGYTGSNRAGNGIAPASIAPASVTSSNAQTEQTSHVSTMPENASQGVTTQEPENSPTAEPEEENESEEEEEIENTEPEVPDSEE